MKEEKVGGRPGVEPGFWRGVRIALVLETIFLTALVLVGWAILWFVRHYQPFCLLGVVTLLLLILAYRLTVQSVNYLSRTIRRRGNEVQAWATSLVSRAEEERRVTIFCRPLYAEAPYFERLAERVRRLHSFGQTVINDWPREYCPDRSQLSLPALEVSDAWVKEQDTLDKYLWRQNIVSGGPQTIPADIVTENVGLDPVDLITAYAKIHKQKPLVFREWSRDNPGPIDYISTNRSFLSSPVSAYLWEPVLRLFDRRCQIDYRLTKERAQRICRLVEATAVPGKPLVVICRGPLIFRLVIAGLGRQGWYCPYRGAWLTFFKKRKWFY